MRFALIACGVSLLGLGLATACSSPTIHTIDLTEGDGGTASSTNPTNPKPGTSGGTSGTSGTSGATGNTTCDKICAAAASANCSKQSTCVADCEADAAKIPAGCKTEADALQACAAKATSFKCSSTGKPTVASGCDDEGNALLKCLTSGG